MGNGKKETHQIAKKRKNKKRKKKKKMDLKQIEVRLPARENECGPSNSAVPQRFVQLHLFQLVKIYFFWVNLLVC